MSNTLTPDTLLDITHEALLRNWDKLQQWAYEEHEREIILREILAQLEKWLKNNRDTQYLLSAGSLSYFEKWWTGIEVNKAMWMRRYLEGGIRADDLADKERKTQNAKQKKQEIEEYLSESRGYHNRKKRIQQIAIGIICVLLVTAVGGLIYSWNLKNKISVISHSNAIATKAYRTLEKDPTLAFRLAEQAYKIAPEPLAKEVLMASYGEMPFYQVLRGHTDMVGQVKYSPDGNRIATACYDGLAKIWDKNGKFERELKGHKGALQYGNPGVINFSSDSKLIVTASNDSTARLWEVSSGKCLTIMKHKRAVSSAVFSPDGTKILTASADKTAKLWDLNGKELVALKHNRGVSAARFSFDGEKIFTASWDSTAKIWTKDGTLKQILSHPISVRKLVVSNNDSLIITGASDLKFRMWKRSQNENWILFKTLEYTNGQDRSITFSNDNKYFITSSDDNETRVWDFNGIEKFVIRGHSSGVWSTQFSPDNKQILTASDDGTARLWDLNGTELMVLKGHTDQVLSANFSPDGNYVVTASGDKTARIWNIKPKENPVLRGHTAQIWDANFSPNGKFVVTASCDYSARVWKSNGEFLSTLYHPNYYIVLPASFSQTSDKILTANSNYIYVWNLSGLPLDTLKHNEHISQTFDYFSKSGKLILTKTDVDTVFVWTNSGKKLFSIGSAQTSDCSNNDSLFLCTLEDSTCAIFDFQGKKIMSFKGHSAPLTSATFSPNDQMIVTSSQDSTARIWNLSGKCLYILKGHTAALTDAKFSHDGIYIITVSQDNTVRIWDIHGKNISIIRGHSSSIQETNFSIDDKQVITASNDNTYRLWAINGNEIQTFTNHKGAVWKAKFSPDNRYILTASDDHTARIMPVSVEMALDKINKEKVRGEVMQLSVEDLKIFGITK